MASLLTKRQRARKLFLPEEGYYPKKDDCADYSGNNLSYNGPAPVDTEPAKEIATDEPTDDTDNDVDQQSVAGTLENLACKPAGNGTQKDCNNDTHSFSNY